ncbi:MAG: hypothetical protein NTX28_06300 [Novosphingobium sp.]|nr:hypothetical protein [Novosphingobium sp.]
MSRQSLRIGLCSAMAVGQAGTVPDWVHLLPQGLIRTVDGRGPYNVKSLQAVADASLAKAPHRLPIDECHSIDRAQPLGMSAPAIGWIVELQARGDGLWGRVEWSRTGRTLLSDRAYQGISPAILHTASGEVVQVLRASLTNTPNLQGLTALHSQGQNAPPVASLNAEDRMIVSLFGMEEAEYRKAMAAQGFSIGG